MQHSTTVQVLSGNHTCVVDEGACTIWHVLKHTADASIRTLKHLRQPLFLQNGFVADLTTLVNSPPVTYMKVTLLVHIMQPAAECCLSTKSMRCQLCHLLQVYIRIDQPQTALKQYSEAATRQAGQVDLLLGQARVHDALDDLEQGVKLYKQASALSKYILIVAQAYAPTLQRCLDKVTFAFLTSKHRLRHNGCLHQCMKCCAGH